MSAEKIVDLRKTKKAGREKPEAETKPREEREFPTILSEKPLISWTCRDHVPPQRSVIWFFCVGLIALALGTYAIWTQNFLFAAFIFIALFTIFFAGRREPKNFKIDIFPEGVKIDEKTLIPFTEVSSFWIFPGMQPPILNLKPKHRLKTNFHILLENIDPEDVRDVLLNYLPEKEEEYPFAERIAEMLGL